VVIAAAQTYSPQGCHFVYSDRQPLRDMACTAVLALHSYACFSCAAVHDMLGSCGGYLTMAAVLHWHLSLTFVCYICMCC
jgi:hypothetical protein